MIRNARLDDVPAIHELINAFAQHGRMLFRSLADLYESIRDFKVYEKGGRVLGCCALQIMWADLAEIKSLSVSADCQGLGIGAELVQATIQEAKELHLPRIFTLALEKEFFAKQGFHQVTMDSLPMKVWSDCVRCAKQDNCDEIAMLIEL